MNTYIKVFITRKHKIRVRISKVYESFEPENSSVEEVTVGGKKWNSGKYNEYKREVSFRIKKLIQHLENQYYEHL